jgi:hypothetical protein
MSITLLAAWQQACGESGFEVPTNIVTDNPQMRYLATASIRRLRPHQWQKLVKQGSITLTTATEYTLATDFWSYVPGTLWPVSSGRPADLPVTVTDWAMLRAGIGFSSIAFNCRIYNDKLQVQNPEADYVLQYEYISKNAVTSSGGTAQETFSADTDLCILDEELFIQDLKWRFKKEKGIDDWQVDALALDAYLAYRKGVDAGSQVLRPMSGTVFPEPYADLWRP